VAVVMGRTFLENHLTQITSALIRILIYPEYEDRFIKPIGIQ
jgi:hypothetical protein